MSSPDLDDYIVRSSTSDAEGTGRGILTEVFVDDDDNITITQIWTYVAQVDGDYDTDDGELDLATLEGAEFDADDYTLTDDDFDNLDAYADEDYVLVTVASGEIQSIQPAETVSGAVTAYTVGSNVTLDGERYYYSKSYTQGTLTKTDGTYDPLSYDLNEDYTLVLDGNSYVVYSDATDATHDYVLIARVAPIGGVNSSVEALAYFTDGTSATIDVDDDSTATFGDEDLVEVEPTGSSSYVVVNQWYEYSERSNGEYRLSDVDDGEKGTVKSSSSGDVDIITSGSTSVLVDNTGSSNDTIRVNNSTLFVINNDGDISTFTGCPRRGRRGPGRERFRHRGLGPRMTRTIPTRLWSMLSPRISCPSPAPAATASSSWITMATRPAWTATTTPTTSMTPLSTARSPRSPRMTTTSSLPTACIAPYPTTATATSATPAASPAPATTSSTTAWLTAPL